MDELGFNEASPFTCQFEMANYWQEASPFLDFQIALPGVG